MYLRYFISDVADSQPFSKKLELFVVPELQAHFLDFFSKENLPVNFSAGGDGMVSLVLNIDGGKDRVVLERLIQSINSHNVKIGDPEAVNAKAAS